MTQQKSWKIKMTTQQYILELLKEEPKTLDELVKITGELRHSIRGILSIMRRNNFVIKLSNQKFDLTTAYKKGLS